MMLKYNECITLQFQAEISNKSSSKTLNNKKFDMFDIPVIKQDWTVKKLNPFLIQYMFNLFPMKK